MTPFHAAIHAAEAAIDDIRHSDATDKLVNAAQQRLAEARKQTKDEPAWKLLWEATSKLHGALDPSNRETRGKLVKEADDLLGTLHGGVHIGDPD